MGSEMCIRDRFILLDANDVRHKVRTQNEKRFSRIRRDTMKEMLDEALWETHTDDGNIVSTIPPSRLDGFMNGLNVLLRGRVGCYQVINI